MRLTWRAHEPAGFVWETLGAEQFLFNPLSGQTHVLNPLGALVLEALSAESLSTPQLLDLLKERQGGANNHKPLIQHLMQHLQQLEQLGLIKRMS